MDTPMLARTACFMCATNETMWEKNEEEMVFEEVQSRLRRNGIEVREGQLLKLTIKR